MVFPPTDSTANKHAAYTLLWGMAYFTSVLTTDVWAGRLSGRKVGQSERTAAQYDKEPTTSIVRRMQAKTSRRRNVEAAGTSTASGGLRRSAVRRLDDEDATSVGGS